MGSSFSQPDKICKSWRDRGMRLKLVVLLMTTTAIPVGIVTHSIIHVAEENLTTSLESSLKKDSVNFSQQLDQLKNDHLLQAINLANTVQLSKLELNAERSAPNASIDLDQIMSWTFIETRYHPSFYIITDTNSRTVAQKTWTITDTSLQASLSLPQANPTWKPSYDIQRVPTRVDLTDIAVIKVALASGEAIASAELINSETLIKMRLMTQASMPLRPQRTKDLSPEKRPFPEDTFDIEQGEIGMVMMAVVPIVRDGKSLGAAIVGTLLNRNYQIVDDLKSSSNLSGATIFAKDLRISTNMPYKDGTTRAIATRASRESMDSVLNKEQAYQGQTIVVNDRYQTIYQPIYDHRREFDSKAKPIGSYFVGIKETDVSLTIRSLEHRGYWIGSGVMILMGMIAIPLANAFAKPLKQLSQLAETIGQGENLRENGYFESFRDRADEVGVLARELDHMTDRLGQNLSKVKASEQQLRTQTHELEHTLKELSAAQAQLIQSEKMSGLGQLVAGVAHEINNPVNFIYGNLKHTDLYTQDLLHLVRLYQAEYLNPSETIQDALEYMDWEFLAKDLPSMMASMRMGADRIKEIVLSLRTFSRMDEAEYKLTDIETGIESTLTILNHRLKGGPKTPVIQVKRIFSELPKVECYAGQLNQVFMNILVNAIDAIEDAQQQLDYSPEITIETTVLDNNWIAISIMNSGPAIPEEIRSRLFDPFFTTKEVGKGTGMGLAISYQIVVDRHKGNLRCESIADYGTRFIIEIPMQQSIEIDLV